MRAFFYAMLGICFGLLAACQTPPMPPAGKPAAVNSAGERIREPYRLDAGDRIKITLYDEPALSGEYLLANDGAISFPLLGAIEVKGLSLEELIKTVETRLREEGILLKPQATAEVLNYRPFFILGEVNRPGEYPFSSDLTVYNAIARAGGLTYRANSKRIQIRRAGEDSFKEFDLTTTTPVEPGDTIRILERLI